MHLSPLQTTKVQMMIGVHLDSLPAIMMLTVALVSATKASSVIMGDAKMD